MMGGVVVGVMGGRGMVGYGRSVMPERKREEEIPEASVRQKCVRVMNAL